MSGGVTPVRLPGSARDDAPLRVCAKCGNDTTQGGGVQVTATKWSCGRCWQTRRIGEETRARSVSKGRR